MTTVYDVPAWPLIKKTAEKLKRIEEIKPPEWAPFVKTGPHKEKPPEQSDWWYIRAAAVLRKVYIYGPVGVERLRAKFGGRRDRGSKPYHPVKGSGSIIRKSLQQLEAAKLIKYEEGKGRVISSEGRRMLDNLAYEVEKELLNVK